MTTAGAVTVVLIGAWLLVCGAGGRADPQDVGVVAEGATPVLLQGGFQFTEGPACDRDGSVVFSDVRASRAYRWTPEGQITLWREDTAGANGMFFGPDGLLYVCESANGRIVAVDRAGQVSVVAAEYRGKRFNRPNDIWVAPQGGVYFTDPNYGGAELSQDGEHVYYVSPDRARVVRVIDDMVRPNGLVGTRDGRTLYVTDAGAAKTWRFRVNEDGSLSERTLFVEFGGDGTSIDAEGNFYLATDAVVVFNPAGELIERIELAEQPTNMCFAGPDLRTLFVTARSSVFTVAMRVCGVAPYEQPTEAQQ
ncbi:MAG: SMP-30/gluconolactonase/LRE family protein [Armatimonadota bacterium]